jgi:hypothetical protein
MIRSCPAGAVPTRGGLAGAAWTMTAATERGRALAPTRARSRLIVRRRCGAGRDGSEPGS